MKVTPEHKKEVEAVIENEIVITPAQTIIVPAKTSLVLSWREWATKEQRELNKVTEEVWHQDDGRTYEENEIVRPPATWQPDSNSDESEITQYNVAMCYLTMEADPEFAGQWISDEL